MKRRSRIMLIIVTLVFCVAASFFCWFVYEFYKAFEAEGSINNAADHRIAGEYSQAIVQYKKTIQIGMGRKGEGWAHEVMKAKNGLIECYQKTGQYEAALKEIDWLLERKVLATPELLERKKQIQELLNK
jgi:hypothetical protein